jgi:chromosomal replication initiation ATPase DnaA
VSQLDVHEVWKKACKHLSDVLHEDVFSRWIAIIEPCSLNDGTLTLAVDNDFYQTWLEENYLSLIESAIGTVHGEPLKILFTVESRGHVRQAGNTDAQ